MACGTLGTGNEQVDGWWDYRYRQYNKWKTWKKKYDKLLLNIRKWMAFTLKCQSYLLYNV